MAAMHPVPSSSFSTWSPLAVTATACLGAAILRITHKINTLATSIIAVGAIAQYLLHRSNAKSTLDSYAQDSFDAYKCQADDLAIKNRSLKTALDELKQSKTSVANERLALSESQLSKAIEEKKQLENEINEIRELSMGLEMSFVVYKQATEQRLPDLNSEDDKKRKVAEQALEDSWIQLGSDLDKKIELAEKTQEEMKRIECELNDLQQSQTQLKQKEQELNKKINELIRLADFDNIFKYIRETDTFLKEVFEKIDSKFRQAFCYEKLTNFIQTEIEQKNDLSEQKMDQLYRLSKFNTSTAPAPDIVLKLLHSRANLVKLADYFNELNQIKIMNFENSS